MIFPVFFSRALPTHHIQTPIAVKILQYITQVTQSTRKQVNAAIRGIEPGSTTQQPDIITTVPRPTGCWDVQTWVYKYTAACCSSPRSFFSNGIFGSLYQSNVIVLFAGIYTHWYERKLFACCVPVVMQGFIPTMQTPTITVFQLCY